MMNFNRDDSRVQLPPFAPMLMERTHGQQALPNHHVILNQPLSEPQQSKNANGRIRVKKACNRCKKQKTKCDGEIPCATCSKTNNRCEYTSSTQHSQTSPESDQIEVKEEKKNEDYVKYLESRVLQLERYIKKTEIDPVVAKETFNKNMYTISRDKYRVMRRYQNIIPFELAYSVFKTLDEKELEDLIIPRIQFYGWNMNGGHYLKQRTLPHMVHLIDFSRDLDFANWLVDYFMLKINPLFSIIHEKVFRDQYEKYVFNLKSDDSDESTRLFSAILYLIFANSLRYAENDKDVPQAVKAKIVPDLEEQLFDSAYEVVNKLSFEWQSFELIQSWILITFYLRTTSRQNSSYMSLGTAIRMCKGMSLDLDIMPETLANKPYEKTKGNRIFWLVYTWDKLHGFQSGKGSEIIDKNIVRELPDLKAPMEDDWLSKPALAMIHLSRIAGKILNYNSSHHKIDSEFMAVIHEDLETWKKWFDQNSDGYYSVLIDQVYFTYHDIILSFNNKALLRLVDKSYYADEGNVQLQLLIKHSSQVLERFKGLANKSQIFIPWWMNLVLLFNISLISVTLINAGLHFSVCSQNFKLSIDLLLKLEGKAHMAKECVWALKMLNRMCVARMQKSMETLTRIGVDHGPDEVNRVKYLQFGKVDDQTNKKRRREESIEGDNMGEFNLEGLLGNLKWFDQWVKELE